MISVPGEILDFESLFEIFDLIRRVIPQKGSDLSECTVWWIQTIFKAQ
jgi:hypothetical protein